MILLEVEYERVCESTQFGDAILTQLKNPSWLERHVTRPVHARILYQRLRRHPRYKTRTKRDVRQLAREHASWDHCGFCLGDGHVVDVKALSGFREQPFWELAQENVIKIRRLDRPFTEEERDLANDYIDRIREHGYSWVGLLVLFWESLGIRGGYTMLRWYRSILISILERQSIICSDFWVNVAFSAFGQRFDSMSLGGDAALLYVWSLQGRQAIPGEISLYLNLREIK